MWYRFRTALHDVLGCACLIVMVVGIAVMSGALSWWVYDNLPWSPPLRVLGIFAVPILIFLLLTPDRNHRV